MKPNQAYRISAICGLAALCLWWGCSKPSEVEQPDQVLYVQAFLVPGQDTEVTLRRTLPPEQYYDSMADSVGGALLQITANGETYTLTGDPSRPGTYRIPHSTMPVVSGRTYDFVATIDGEQIHAATLVPDPVQITEVTADTVVYMQHFGDLFGELQHPGEWSWTRSDNSAGYVIIVEAVDVHSLDDVALPLTADLDTLLAQRERLDGQVSSDSLARLDQRINEIRQYLQDNVRMVNDQGDTLRWLRDRDQEDWDDIDADPDDSEGARWRDKMDALFNMRFVDYWVPQDTLRADYWWLGLRFEGEYRVTVQAADRNYVDYFNTSTNGFSGNDGDSGPLFNVDNGLGVFGSYAPASFSIHTVRGEAPYTLKVAANRE